MMKLSCTLSYRQRDRRHNRIVNALKMPDSSSMICANASAKHVPVKAVLPSRRPSRLLNEFTAEIVFLLKQTLASGPRFVLLVPLAGVIFIKDCQRVVSKT